MNTKPVVVVSRCLGFAACRYDGQQLSNTFIRKLSSYVTFQTVCPEVEVGMGAPRSPIRLVNQKGNTRLIQPETGNDFTEAMQSFSKAYCQSLNGVDGFILKNRSPSCGIKDAKIYAKVSKSPSLGKSSGLFAEEVIEHFGGLAIEDEGRLTNTKLREHFLIKLFTLSRFRDVQKNPSLQALMHFQKNHKLLFMAYNQAQMRKMGNLVGQANKQTNISELLKEYEAALHRALARPARVGSHINALMHALGYFSKQLATSEKAFFLESLEKYRDGQIPLISLLSLLQSWTIRFNSKYLAQQIYFTPYPEALLQLTEPK